MDHRNPSASSKLPSPRKARTMAASLKGLLNRFTPNASSSDLSGFTKARTAQQLFPTTDPAIDGEECLRDCDTCTIHYPNKFSIDETEVLFGRIKGWSRHILCATGKTDWVCKLNILSEIFLIQSRSEMCRTKKAV